ncbi:MAG: flavin reductase family protein [Brevundimonas sp.]|uniref:flavin reductase family protein n=1 Tax=Brevundimonas sp. TaxID=1871086 RepID=UPI00182593BF|nr:flavin reductase family protein [Brevundimonas sp.]MBA4803210.1 flavin reductase family protein [Brevundimonas sp.]
MTLEPPPARPSADTVAYRRALGTFATGVCVVTADSDQGPLGLTINSFTSVSLEPRLVLWCLDERSERWPTFAAAERFAIHVLPAADQEKATRFARGAAFLQPDEFERPPDGPPCLPEALARFECEAHERLPMGDHMMIVGRVYAFTAADGAALTYWRGRYGSLGDLA